MFLYAILFLSILQIHYSAGQQCNASGLRKFDTTFAKLLTLGSSGRLFPENKEDQLKKYCDQSDLYIKDIDKYKGKCMANLPRQITGVIVFSVKNTISQYCKRDSKRLTELISSTPCANKAKGDFDHCYANLIDSYQGAIHAVEKKRVPHICCEYFRMFKCVHTRAIKNKECTETQIDQVSDFIRELFGNVVDLICGDYTENSDKCDKLPTAPKKKKSQRRTKSFMLPMIDALASLPEL